MSEIVDFVCPKCTSRYKLVRVRVEQEVPSRLIYCRVYKEPLSSTDGKYALKYFLVDKPKKRNSVDLRMKHARALPAAQPRPVQDRRTVQQQHQVQPKDDDKKG